MKLEYRDCNLILRQLNETSASQVLDFYYRNKAYFDVYEADKPDNFYTLEYVKGLLRSEYNAFVQGKYVRFFAYDINNPKEIIGTVSFSDLRYGHMMSCVIGYKVDHQLQNQGYGYRMLNAALKAMVVDARMHRIEAYIAPNNTASINLVKKLGFINEGTAYSYIHKQQEWLDMLRFVYIS